jgi:hypothetical protein
MIVFFITGEQATSFLDCSLWKNYFVVVSSFDFQKSVWSISDAVVTISIYVCFLVLEAIDSSIGKMLWC